MDSDEELDERARWVVATLIELAKTVPQEVNRHYTKRSKPLQASIAERIPKWRPVEWVPPPKR